MLGALKADTMKNWKSIFCYGLVLLVFVFLLESLAYIRTEVEREIALEKSKSLSRVAETGINVCFIDSISNLKQRIKQVQEILREGK